MNGAETGGGSPPSPRGRPRSGPPQHLSHSSRDTLLRCAKSYFLSRIAGAPKRPALWSAGGSAVHEVTEAYDRAAVAAAEVYMDVGKAWKAAFDDHLRQAFKAEPDEWKWGRAPSEPIETWNTLGPQFIQAYIDWRQRSPWTIWTTPDGTPAIELDVSGMLPGCPVEVKGYVDRVFHDPVLDRLVVLDLKTGKRPPKSADQFGTYAALTEAKYDVHLPVGVPFMNRKATLGKPYDLVDFTPESVGAVFGEAWELIQESTRTGQWPIDTEDCYICDVSASCYAKNGPLAQQFDPAHPGHASNRPPY